jgi:hypothetical protein
VHIMAYARLVIRLPEERGRMLVMAGRNSHCELYNALRCSTAYRITFGQSGSYADELPLIPTPYREESSSPLWGYPYGLEASGEGPVRQTTPQEQCSPVARSGKLPRPSALADVVDGDEKFETRAEPSRLGLVWAPTLPPRTPHEALSVEALPY